MQVLPRSDEAPRPAGGRTPSLHLVESTLPAARTSSPAMGAWILLFGSLTACAGHGLFLFSALTRLAKVPSRLEIGGPLAQAVIGWFVLSMPLALLAVVARRPFQRLGARSAWSLASVFALASTMAFVLYVRAIALA
jgi:hypothetical protein